MPIVSRLTWTLSAIFMVTALGSGNASAQSPYPGKPIRLIVPFSPGGGTDIVGRVMAQGVSKVFKQTVVVDNRGGAGGVIGMELEVRATPDGYTLGMITASVGTNAAAKRLSFDPQKAMVPISMIAETGYLITLHPSVPIKTTQELIDYARAHPGKLNYGSSGTGGTAHLTGELFDLMAGVKTTHIPYKSSGPALTDLLAGQIQMIYGSLPVVMPHMKSGRLKVVAITTAKRNRALPDVPAIAETVPGYESVTWYGLIAPRGTPRSVALRWEQALTQALQTREMKGRLDADGLDLPEVGPAHLGQVMRRDITKWTKVLKAANIQIGK
jgi:tripartite-type tricarboxylate transporter receptor subunit TctC